MGARGIGARPIKRKTVAELAAVKPKPWERRGLTRAQRVISFIQHLTITSGPHAGRKFGLRPWQKEWIREWYATDRRGRRIVRTAVLSVSRKNGKSSICAALAACHLIGPEREPRGQIIVGAADRDQSGIIFDELAAMLEADDELASLVNIRRHEKVIDELAGKSKFKALSSDAKKAHGLSGSVVILDELGVWGSGIGLRLYNALMTSSGARKEPLKIVISTQAEDDLSKMSELLDYGEQVNDGIIPNPSFWCRCYNIPEDLDPFDEKNWKLANPALGDFRCSTTCASWPSGRDGCRPSGPPSKISTATAERHPRNIGLAAASGRRPRAKLMPMPWSAPNATADWTLAACAT